MNDSLELEIEDLITRGFESPDVDYKAPGDWNVWGQNEKCELVRDVIALANSDKPGWLILGVSEKNDGTFRQQGLTEAQAASFDPTPIGEKISQHADPAVPLRVHKRRVDGRLYVAIQVQPFQTLPHICVRNGGNGVLQQASIYVRTEACQTTKLTDVDHLRRLVDRATLNSADELVARINELMKRAHPERPDPKALFERQIEDARRGPRGTP